MKHFTIAVVVVLAMVSASAQAAVVINNSWEGGITFVEKDTNEREVYTINDQSAVPMYNVVKGHTKYADTRMKIVDGELHMGNCIYDIAQAHHGVSLEYAWNAELTNVGVQFHYEGRANDFTYLSVSAGYRLDMSDFGTQYVFEVFRTTESGDYTIAPSDIKAVLGDRPFNVLYIQESDIGISNDGVLDDIIITADNVPSPAPPFVIIQKPGMYTTELVTGTASADIYVNGVITTTIYSSFGYIGVLEVGDEVRIVANGKEAESIEEIDSQSWNFFYNGETIQIYVEDTPVPECEPEIVEVIKEVEVPLEVIKEVEVVKEIIVEVPGDCPVIEPAECTPETIEVPISIYEGIDLECNAGEKRKVCNWKSRAKHFLDKIANEMK